jgi:DNA modification methylase
MQWVKLTQVRPNPNNPRVMRDEKFAKLKQSIIDFPEMLEKRPLVCYTEGEHYIVLGGNMRLKALSDIGAKEIPIILADEWTEEQRAQFLIKDNVGFGEWDWNTLANEWDADKLTEWGLDLPPMDAIELEAEEDDYKMPEQIETDIVLGDLFEIGEHRLLCGDSTDSDAVAKLMNGEKAELLFTSPPYSDMREYNGEKDLSVSNLIEFIPTFMPYANFQVINLGLQRKDNEIVQYWNEYIEMAKSCGYKFLSWNVWNREGAGFSMAQITAMFAIQHEWIFVFGNNRKELNLTVPNKDAGEFNDHSSNRQKDGTVKKGKNMTIRSHRQLGTVNSIINEQSREWTKFHPAVFPIALPEEYIKAMTNEGHIVAESFTGSGTTMVASHQLKRKCYGMELDPKYCQVIVDRMIKLDPTLQIKRNGQTYNRQTTDGE